MIRVSREWATPVTAGVFVVMAVTGVLMFFHLDVGLNKLAHEWLGWGMVAAVAAHGVANWPALRRYLVASRKAQALLGVAVAVLTASFFVGGGEPEASPPLLTLQAIAAAPLKDVAPIAHKPLAQLQAELAAAGLPATDGEQTLAKLTGGDRAKMGRAVRVVFGAKG